MRRCQLIWRYATRLRRELRVVDAASHTRAAITRASKYVMPLQLMALAVI